MRRIFMIVLLCGLICLLGATSALAVEKGPVLTFTGMEIAPLPEKYNEVPMLKVKVAAGELPPVEERIPEEPLLVEPYEEIGEYGGTLHVGTTGIAYAYDFGPIQDTPSYLITPEGTFPYLAKKWEFSKDGKTLTIYLRKGMRWSDGAPLTTEDVKFYWNDVFHNKDLTPAISPWLEGATLEVVDDSTFRLHFPKLNPLASTYRGWTGIFASPKHYLKRFHIKYNPRATELAKKEGYTDWWELFQYRSGYAPGKELGAWWNPDLPGITPWIIKRVETAYLVYERNPYFWQIDTAGNQLPYIDRVRIDRLADTETYVLKAISGELSYAGAELTLEDTPLYRTNAERGDYRVLLWKGCFAVEVHYLFNLNNKDPILKKIFRDIRFKKAMSLAINRDEINEAIYFGEATPRQSTVLPSFPYYKPEYAKAYAQYNPDQANALLAEMGLKWDENHQWRLRPDGKALSIVAMVPASKEAAYMPVSELVKEYWEDVGVNMVLKEAQFEFWWPKIRSNDYDVAVQHMDEVTLAFFLRGPSWFVPYTDVHGWGNTWAYQWHNWFQTKGKSGEEPPEEIKHLQSLRDVLRTTLDEKQRARVADELLRAQAENLWSIGTVGMSPHSMIVKNNLRNVPEEGYWGFDYLYFRPAMGTQWFFKQK